MGRVTVIVVALVAVMSAATLAGDYNQGSTTGFTSISQVLVDPFVVKSPTDILEYNWLLTNNTGTSASPVIWNILVWSLQPFNVPTHSSTPYACLADGITLDTDWRWKAVGWESGVVTSSAKYYAPPAIGPGQTKTFVYKFKRQFLGTIGVNEDTDEIGSMIGFTAHVAAVIWDADKQKWAPAPESVYGSVSTSQTWFDYPTCGAAGHHDPVPEASSVILGVMGFMSTGGFAFFRKRKS